MASKGAPPEIGTQVNKSLTTAWNTPVVRQRLGAMGCTPLGGSPARFARLLDEGIQPWGEVVRFSGAQVD